MLTTQVGILSAVQFHAACDQQSVHILNISHHCMHLSKSMFKTCITLLSQTSIQLRLSCVLMSTNIAAVGNSCPILSGVQLLSLAAVCAVYVAKAYALQHVAELA